MPASLPTHLQKALRNEPIERFDRGKIQPRIERVRKAFGEGDTQFALEILTELESEGHIDPDMSFLRIQIEQVVRQKTIRQLIESARIRVEEEEYPTRAAKDSGCSEHRSAKRGRLEHSRANRAAT